MSDLPHPKGNLPARSAYEMSLLARSVRLALAMNVDHFSVFAAMDQIGWR